MVVLMKLVSVGFDLDASSIPALPGPLEFLGYTLNPGTILFGPWLSFNSYMQVLQPMAWVSHSLIRENNWINGMIASDLLSKWIYCFLVQWLEFCWIRVKWKVCIHASGSPMFTFLYFYIHFCFLPLGLVADTCSVDACNTQRCVSSLVYMLYNLACSWWLKQVQQCLEVQSLVYKSCSNS